MLNIFVIQGGYFFSTNDEIQVVNVIAYAYFNTKYYLVYSILINIDGTGLFAIVAS